MKISFVSALILVSANAFAIERPNIVNGTTVQAGDPVAETTVFISIKHIGNYESCTGSLIADDIVVTAAHCVEGISASGLQIFFTRQVSPGLMTGKPSSSSGVGSVRDVFGAIANPDYSTSGIDRHDIGIIRFKGTLPEGYHPATLLADSAALNAGEEVTLAGFGSSVSFLQMDFGLLRKGNVLVEAPLGQTEMILNEKGGSAACWGDSGGPAFVDSGAGLLLWGLTNRPYPTENPICSGASVYTRITRYADFIASAEATLREMQ